VQPTDRTRVIPMKRKEKRDNRTEGGARGESSGTRERAGKYLTFFLETEEYGVGILGVKEIIGLQPVTRLPQAPHFIRGVINLRGRVIPVADLRLRFGMSQIPDTEETCIVVVETGPQMLGMVVDRVSEVLEIPDGDIVDSPTIGDDGASESLLGIGKSQSRVTLLLDLEAVFPAESMAGLVN